MIYALSYFIISPPKLKACDFVDRTRGGCKRAHHKNDEIV